MKDLLKLALEAQECEVIEVKGNGVYVVKTGDNKKHVMTSELPHIGVGTRGKLVGETGFIREPYG